MRARTRVVPRKQPRQERSQATVEAILTATARILVKEGFDRASTNRIAEQAGVSIGSLYQYFPSKEALVTTLMQRHIDEISNLVSGAVERLSDAPIPAAMREIVDLMICAHAIDPQLHKVLMEQVPRIMHFSHGNEVERQVLRLARTYLEARARELRPKNIGLAALIVVQTIESLTHSAVIGHPDLLETEELKEEITQLIVRYLMKDPERPDRPERRAR
jgi:AcrR family transcriptional regulator